MSLSNSLTNLASGFRSTTGYTDKLGLADMANMVAGLSPYNLLTGTSNEYQTAKVSDGQWEAVPFASVYLPAGEYTFSIYVDATGYNSNISNRVEWTANYDKCHSLTGNTMSWGTLDGVWVNGGKKGLLTVSFSLGAATVCRFGLSGSPFIAGTFKYKQAMLNAGRFTMPYTSTTLQKVGGGS